MGLHLRPTSGDTGAGGGWTGAGRDQEQTSADLSPGWPAADRARLRFLGDSFYNKLILSEKCLESVDPLAFGLKNQSSHHWSLKDQPSFYEQEAQVSSRVLVSAHWVVNTVNLKLKAHLEVFLPVLLLTDNSFFSVVLRFLITQGSGEEKDCFWAEGVICESSSLFCVCT